MHTPKISVIMPVLNNEIYLADAIDSILRQTLPDFEFIIISEFGNSVASVNVLKSYAALDRRICLIQNESKLNISASLNLGMDLARGEYIARMDADDISLPERFAVQAAFLDAHSEISICASAVRVIDAKGRILNRLDPNPYDPDQIYADLLFYCCIQHPTVMMRQSALSAANLRYNPDYTATEDYDFWIRAGQQLKIECLQDALLLYRLHPDNASRLRKEQCIKNFLAVMRDNFLRFDMCFSDEQLRILCPITCEMRLNNLVKYYKFIDIVASEMLQKNLTLKLYNQDSLAKTLRKRAFWHKAPWRLIISATARSFASLLRIFSYKASDIICRSAFCVETYGVRELQRVIIEYFRERISD